MVKYRTGSTYNGLRASVKRLSIGPADWHGREIQRKLCYFVRMFHAFHIRQVGRRAISCDFGSGHTTRGVRTGT